MRRLIDRIVPDSALRWGPLTVEPVAWHLDQMRYVFAEMHRAVFEPLLPVVGDIANVIADAARTFPDIFPIGGDQA